MTEEQEQMIEDCENRSEKLTDWEAQYIDSLSMQVGKGKGLSPKQEEILDRIWEKVT